MYCLKINKRKHKTSLIFTANRIKTATLIVQLYFMRLYMHYIIIYNKKKYISYFVYTVIVVKIGSKTTRA